MTDGIDFGEEEADAGDDEGACRDPSADEEERERQGGAAVEGQGALAVTEYLLDRYPDGTYETFEYDDDTGDITVRRWADVEPVLNVNKAAHLDGDGKTGDMWLAARIPNDVALLWKQLYGVDAWRAEHWPAVRRLLNDPDWKHMRPTSFRL